MILKSKDNSIHIEENGIVSNFGGNPLLKLRELLSTFQKSYRVDLLFIGGPWIGPAMQTQI